MTAMTDRLRKIGEPRIETIVVELTDTDVVELDAKARLLRDRQDALKKELVGVKADFKARGQVLSDAEALARQQASTRKRDAEISVQDYITPGNEVISLRMDTNEVFGRRIATLDELQEGFESDGFGGAPS